MSLADRYQSRPAASTDFACEHYDALPDGKRCRHYVRAALRQADTSTPQGRIPLTVIRDDRAESFVALSLDDFLELVREWWEARTR